MRAYRLFVLTVAIPLALPVGSSLFAETIAQPDAGAETVRIFQQTCLATRGKGMDAAVAAILAMPGVKEGQNLPGYGSGAAPMRTFVDGARHEFLIRPDKKGRYGCFVLLETPIGTPDAALAESIRTALNSTPGLAPKPSKQKKITHHEWFLTASKDDIRFTPDSGVGGMLINLDVK